MGFNSSKSNSQGSSQQTSASLNQAFPSLEASLGGQTAYTGQGNSAISSLLGLSGDQAQSDGFKKYKDSSGFNFTRDQGIEGITSSDAAKGLLGSGSILKGISGYSTNLASQFLDKYMAQLSGLAGSGLQAGQVLAGAGNTANSQGTSNNISSGKSSNFSLG